MALVDRTRQGGEDLAASSEASTGQTERWTRIKTLFLEALQYSASERSAFVARAAEDDDDVRREVESLLASDEAAKSFCEMPAADLLSALSRTESDASSRLEPGTRLGAYEIIEFIAAGGMGEVYRARHTLLGRDVAIKIVSRGLVDRESKRRLIREARHASLLTHPNICAIYDVAEDEAIPFIVMEHVNGKSLGAIVREGVPPWSTSIAYALDVVGALEHAHDRGVIHRDLKSSNVVIDGHDKAVVLDFGLARRVSGMVAQGRESSGTNPNLLAGTLTHMAPEVLRGEEADARSDIWALGVLMYELFTGALPFSGRTAFETSAAILNDAPKAMAPGVPLVLRLIVEKCLIKDPLGRYQTAHAVRQALEGARRRSAWPLIGRLMLSMRRRTVYGGGLAVVAMLGVVILVAGFRGNAPQHISTLAVLPLKSATADSVAAYYADGLTDALIAQLGAASDVRVFSRASTTRVAKLASSPAEVAARLGADVVLDARLRRPNDTAIAIDASIVRAGDGKVLWSQTYERSAREVLALEADVIRDVTTSIRGNLRTEARERLARVRAVSPEVYEEYLKGKYEWNKRTPSSLQLAIQHFESAAALDATYAPAHAALADCYNQLGTVLLGTGSPSAYRPRAASEAIKALQIDPASAEAHAALGYVWHYDLRWADAEREFRRAIELNPSLALAHVWYANLLMSQSRMAEAIAQVYAARELDPFSLVINANVGWVLFYAGRYEEAIAQLRQTLALDSTYLQARSRLVGALSATGQHEEAHTEAHTLVTLSDSAVPYLAGLALTEVHVGHTDSARIVLADLLSRARRQYVPPVSIAHLYASLGAVDSAMVWMERAFAERSNAMAYLAVEPANAPLRADPRFKNLLARAGLE